MTTTFVIYDDAGRDTLIESLRKLPLDPARPWTFRLVPFVDPPTPRQKGYYLGVVLKALCDHTGYTPREMHQILLLNFEHEAGHLVNDDPELLEVRESRAVTSQFIELAVRWAAVTLDCYIPPPERQR